MNRIINIPAIDEGTIHYFDYAATSFMPQCVVDKWCEANATCGVSIGRGSSPLHKLATIFINESEKIFFDFWGLENEYEFAYAKNVTEAINIVALSVVSVVNPMDIIAVGPYEHHSNFLPWKRLAEQSGALFFEIPVDLDGNIEYEFLDKYKNRIKILSVSSTSNSFGYTIDINKIIDSVGDDTYVFVDESQTIAHTNIQTDRRIATHFLASHKMYGPKGIACFAVRKDLLEKMQPILLGGGMVDFVGYNCEWSEGRNKFFAGTLDVASIAAWAEACKFVRNIGYDNIQKQDQHNIEIITDRLKCAGLKIVGNRDYCCNHIISFYSESVHAHDVNEIMSRNMVAIRSGHLCSQNSIRKIGTNAINRISLGLGISDEDIGCLFQAVEEVKNAKILFRNDL